ncbi:lysylphosphatidylglycerol synthase domain-containing protein [Candidatus Poriferisodalis sp.]|uniref:lysylphosphatidylglycerol synthase domain-containing protein n=1 Tax=Candidatus Poriferisodalis sp. TaxID=3101277 RepID=UPI003B029CB5
MPFDPAAQASGAGFACRAAGRAVRWALGLATAAMIVWLAVRSWDDLRSISLDVDAGALVAAVVVSTTATVCLALAWRELIGGYGTPLARRPAVRVWMLSQATRYLPTGLVPLAARAALAAPFGVRRAAAAASVVVETATLAGWAGLCAALWAPSDWLGSAGGWPARAVIGVGAAVGLVTLPWTLAGAGRWWQHIERSARRLPLRRRLSERLRSVTLTASPAAVWRAAVVDGCAVAQRLMAAVLLAAALLAVGADDVWLVAGAVAAGIVAGMVGITPAGLGVREVVVAALLAERFGVGEAAAFAVALRVLEFAHELVLLPASVMACRQRIHAPDSFRHQSHETGSAAP